MDISEFYHISLHIYKKNQELSIPHSQQNHFQSKIKKLKNEWIEDELEKYNPHEKKEIRKTSIFLFDNPYAALCFGEKEYQNQKIHVYKCSAINYVKCIMPAITIIKSYRNNEVAKKKLSEEYWNPQKKYHFFHEYLAEKVIIEDFLSIDDLKNENKYDLVAANFTFECDECESVLN
jgi:hypothetical protein